MNRTKIEYADYTWNPVTGCLHNCKYCFARDFVQRFGGTDGTAHLLHVRVKTLANARGEIIGYDIDNPFAYITKKGKRIKAAFPFKFEPTFHRYRLDEPRFVKKPLTVFVCDMADLFGKWVPEEWIQEVFTACDKAQQHRYLFLTKNPARYIELSNKGKLPERENFWYGSTVVNDNEPIFYSRNHNTFISIEPISGAFDAEREPPADWVIIGAETGKRKNKIIPKFEWVISLVESCIDSNVPIFLKRNLSKVWTGELIQQLPWGKNA